MRPNTARVKSSGLIGNVGTLVSVLFTISEFNHFNNAIMNNQELPQGIFEVDTIDIKKKLVITLFLALFLVLLLWR